MLAELGAKLNTIEANYNIESHIFAHLRPQLELRKHSEYNILLYCILKHFYKILTIEFCTFNGNLALENLCFVNCCKISTKFRHNLMGLVPIITKQ